MVVFFAEAAFDCCVEVENHGVAGVLGGLHEFLNQWFRG